MLRNPFGIGMWERTQLNLLKGISPSRVQVQQNPAGESGEADKGKVARVTITERSKQDHITRKNTGLCLRFSELKLVWEMA
jgi:hypothetical protein